jgi:hypothetical protein
MSGVVEIIEHSVKKAQSLQDFVHTNGSRKDKAILNMPYWIKMNNAWVFDFVRGDMDVDILKHNIKASAVYILESVESK